MESENWRCPARPIRSSWNVTHLLVRGELTDKKIEKYRKAGWYDEAFREARREMMAKKKARKERREGNFLVVDGRMVYSPLA